ncbi:MAG: hypothetical protein LW832_01790 [Parachlamydia sp.]|jgi:hypothetical protein|nr:hypothetical protein [Parachlamydia sp.]
MSSHTKTSSRWLFRLSLALLLCLLLLARIGYGQQQQQAVLQQEAILQGSIQIQPVQPIDEDKPKVQPGSPVKLSVVIHNKGTTPSPQGELYLRYAFAKPLDKEEASVIFETEKKVLPSIEPGKIVEIAFEKPHLLPSLLDFVRDDWSLREYQAFATIDGHENLIASLAVTYSAYYYPGVHKEFPIKVH